MAEDIKQNQDEELAAIGTLLAVLTPLKPDARNNVIEYVFRRLGIAAPGVSVAGQPPSLRPTAVLPPETPAAQQPPNAGPADLRSLRQEKDPKSANQMIAVLAYYLESLVPQDQRRSYVVADDIKRFFPQAGFPLPTFSHSQALANAKNAGFLDALGNGQYRLNPVGHNLVLYKLPPSAQSPSARPSRSVKKAAKKKAKAKK